LKKTKNWFRCCAIDGAPGHPDLSSPGFNPPMVVGIEPSVTAGFTYLSNLVVGEEHQQRQGTTTATVRIDILNRLKYPGRMFQRSSLIRY
jgi:hypothetical protein